jgi:hypothetical protein
VGTSIHTAGDTNGRAEAFLVGLNSLTVFPVGQILRAKLIEIACPRDYLCRASKEPVENDRGDLSDGALGSGPFEMLVLKLQLASSVWVR